MTREHTPAGPCTFEITAFTKHGGPLTKRVRLDPSGKMISDGSACIMSHGGARRVRFDSLNDFAEFVGGLRSNEAIAVGALQPELPDNVEITTKRKLNGAAQLGLITRASDYIIYRPGRPALALLDYDTKGMPPSVEARIDELGGYLPALLSVLPQLATVATMMRRSTSAGIYRT